MPEEIKTLMQLGTDSVVRMFNEFRLMTVEDLKRKMNDPTSTLEELALGKILSECIRTGNFSSLKFIHDRSVGPIIIQTETKITGNLHDQVMDAIRRNNKQNLESE